MKGYSLLIKLPNIDSLKGEFMQQFHYKALPVDVHFGVGKSNEVKDILIQHGYQKVLVITTPGQEEAGRQLAIEASGDYHCTWSAIQAIALAETANDLYKSEVIDYLKHKWNGVNDVELATSE